MPPWGALTGISSRRFLTIPTVLWFGRTVSASMSSVRMNWPLPGETIRRQVGLPVIRRRMRHCRASERTHRPLELIRRIQGEDLRALEVPFGDAGQQPAGGISSRPVTPRSPIAAMHRSQRTGEAT